MREMATLVMLVPVLSLFSYFVITSGVRKYKAYLDSGLDYKHLVKSITNIEDLTDEKRIKKLGAYPELRDFLMKIKNSVAEREAALKKREKTAITGIRILLR